MILKILQNVTDGLHMRLLGSRGPRTAEGKREIAPSSVSPWVLFPQVYLSMSHILQTRGFSCKMNPITFSINLSYVFSFPDSDFALRAPLLLFLRLPQHLASQWRAWRWVPTLLLGGRVCLQGKLLELESHLWINLDLVSSHRHRSPSAHFHWLCRWAPLSSCPSQPYPTRWVNK